MDRFIISLIVIIGGITGMVLYQIFQSDSKQLEQNNSIPSVITPQTPIDENPPRTLAETSPLVKANLMSGGYRYEGISYSGNQSYTFVNVVYQSTNGTVGPIVVTEDRHSTKILSVEIQPARSTR